MSLSFVTTNKAIGQQNTISLQMLLINPVARTAYIRIATPLSLSFQFNLIFPTGAIPNAVTSASNELLLRNFTSGASDNKNYNINNFTLTNPPYANKAVVLTFTT